jgi:hypothetical protein
MTSLSTFEYIIVVSFLVSLTVYYKPVITYKYLQLFPPFLFTTLIAELTGDYIRYKTGNNIPLYNFFSTFEFCFYLWIISVVIDDRRWKKGIRISIPGYTLIALVNIFFIQKIKTFHTITYAFGCLLIVLFCIYYFFELFRIPKSEKLLTNPAFWICSGLLFFYCCGFPLYGLINSWDNISKLVLYNFAKIVTILNFFLYSLFMIAFLCIRIRKYTLSPS